MTVLFRNRMHYMQMQQRPSLSEGSDAPSRMEMVEEKINQMYERQFHITEKLLSEGEAPPQVRRSSRVEGIAMDIEDADE
jgi:hypothetical protein